MVGLLDMAVHYGIAMGYVTKMLRSSSFFFLANLWGGGGDSTAIRLKNQPTSVN